MRPTMPAPRPARTSARPRPQLTERVQAEVERLQGAVSPAPVPADAATASGSGLDPHISPAFARAQIARVAKARGDCRSGDCGARRTLTEGRLLGIIGEPRVNVLELNLALDAPKSRDRIEWPTRTATSKADPIPTRCWRLPGRRWPRQADGFPRRGARRRQDLRDAAARAAAEGGGRRHRRRPGRNPRPRRNGRACSKGWRCCRAGRSTITAASLEEFDLDAALARRPRIIIVDELAHTNAPDSRHPEALPGYRGTARRRHRRLDGAQHPASGKPVRCGCRRSPACTVRERVPDIVLKRADEVLLVDLPPAELIERLNEGKVYLPDNAKRAADSFFRLGNLTALRELALRRTADRVDDQMVDYLKQNAIEGPWPTAERLLVCIGPDGCRKRWCAQQPGWPPASTRLGSSSSIERADRASRQSAKRHAEAGRHCSSWPKASAPKRAASSATISSRRSSSWPGASMRRRSSSAARRQSLASSPVCENPCRMRLIAQGRGPRHPCRDSRQTAGRQPDRLAARREDRFLDPSARTGRSVSSRRPLRLRPYLGRRRSSASSNCPTSRCSTCWPCWSQPSMAAIPPPSWRLSCRRSPTISSSSSRSTHSRSPRRTKFRLADLRRRGA